MCCDNSTTRTFGISQFYFPLLNLPGVAPVFLNRLTPTSPVTVKKESSRPCVLPCLLFTIFLQPLLEQSTTSGFTNKPRASLNSQSSGEGYFCRRIQKTRADPSLPCCLIRSMALLGPIPLIVPQ
uniref:Uncharacterized protein n=1 Tax=Takifugu rubripes TaxID=31033 RepID=A0A3B5K5T6_TAKRU